MKERVRACMKRNALVVPADDGHEPWDTACFFEGEGSLRVAFF